MTHTWLYSCSLEEISECSLIIVLVLQSVPDIVPEFGIVLVHLEKGNFGLHLEVTVGYPGYDYYHEHEVTLIGFLVTQE